MTSLAIILVLAASILHVVRDFLTKKSEDKQIFIWWTVVVSLIFVFPFVIYLLIRDGFPDSRVVWIAVGMSFVHFSYWVFYTKAYDNGDLSQVYPIIRSAPALVLIFAVIFLNEVVSALGVIGILLVTLGVCFINLNGFKLKNFFQFDFRQKYLRFSLVALLSTVVIVLVDKVGVSYINPIIYAFLIAFLGSIIFGIPFYKLVRHEDVHIAH